jgi:hypothetical protein
VADRYFAFPLIMDYASYDALQVGLSVRGQESGGMLRAGMEGGRYIACVRSGHK